MLKKPESVAAYLKSLTGPRRDALEQLRRTIVTLVPGVEECISYSMPAFRFNKHVVAGFIATKKGCSYFPFSGTTLDSVAQDLEGFSRTKAALHFSPQQPLSKTLVNKLLKARLRECEVRVARPTGAQRAKAKAPASLAPLTKKLQVKQGQSLGLVQAPRGLSIEGATRSKKADALLVFVRSKADLTRHTPALVSAATAGKTTWVAYPKAGQQGTDLSRDVVWTQLKPTGLRPARQIAVDVVWSALRFVGAKSRA